MNQILTTLRLGTLILIFARLAWAGPAEDVYAKFAANIVTLDTYDSVLIPARQGSGVFISKGGSAFPLNGVGSWILTNYHVIAHAGLIIATMKDGTKCNAWIVFFDRERDIALLQMQRPANFAKIQAAIDCKVGSEVFAIGAPQGLGWTISGGIISALRKKDDTQVVQFTAPISQGSSGGGLFTSTGELVGVTSFGAKEGQNLNFALLITPEFLTRLERFRRRGGDLPAEINDGWSAGYFEPSCPQPEGSEPSGRSVERITRIGNHTLSFGVLSSMAPVETIGKWDAHTNIIANLEKRLEEADGAMSPSQRSAALREWNERGRTGSVLKSPNNQLTREIERAYLRRFREFPDDVEGWDRYVEQLPVTSAKIDALKKAIEQWPSDYHVLKKILETIAVTRAAFVKGKFSEESMELLFHHVEQIVELLPSKNDLDALFKPFQSPAAWDRINGDREIRNLVESLELHLRHGPSDVPPSLLKRKAKLLDELRDKGLLDPDK